MTTDRRQLLVSAERCLGCRACATVCPEGLITLDDADYRRTVWFAATCGEDCALCVEACPTEAITLQSWTEVVPEARTALNFELSACAGCGAPVATAEMLAWLRTVIPAQVQTDAEGQEWLDLCPRCRQEGEAQRMAREVVMTRWL